MLIAKLFAKYVRYDTKRHDDVRIARQTPPAGAEVREYDYLSDGDPMHKLNIYRPEGNRDTLPLIVNVHGGAWVYGDKDLNKYYCMDLASKGYCVVGMSYRLAPETDIGGQISDVFAALEFVCDNADKFGCDTRGIMLTGDSAGGHLASLAVCIMLDPSLAKAYGVRVPDMSAACLTMSHPVCEVHSVFRRRDCEPAPFCRLPQHIFDNVLFGKRPRRNPLYGVSAFTEYTKGLRLPPVMLIGCERDVYTRHTQYLAKLLSAMEKEGRCEKFVLDFVKTADESRKLRHVYNIVHYEWPESARVNDASLVFFDECRAREKGRGDRHDK